jgi:hypothetical protein
MTQQRPSFSAGVETSSNLPSVPSAPCGGPTAARAGGSPDVGSQSPVTELAALLARAALRLHARTALSPDSAPDCPREAESGEISCDSGRNPLDLSAGMSLHGDRVVDAPERLQPGGSS